MSTFANAVIRQIGRDLGKVVSNQIFKDSHSTPYRRVGTSTQQHYKADKTEFEKVITFKLSYKPNTLIEKLIGSYVSLKKEIQAFLKDDYLDERETLHLIEMIQVFNEKMVSVHEVVTLNNIDTTKLDNLSESYISFLSMFLKHGIKSCKDNKEHYEAKLKSIESNLFRFRAKRICRDEIEIENLKIDSLNEVLNNLEKDL